MSRDTLRGVVDVDATTRHNRPIPGNTTAPPGSWSWQAEIQRPSAASASQASNSGPGRRQALAHSHGCVHAEAILQVVCGQVDDGRAAGLNNRRRQTKIGHGGVGCRHSSQTRSGRGPSGAPPRSSVKVLLQNAPRFLMRCGVGELGRARILVGRTAGGRIGGGRGVGDEHGSSGDGCIHFEFSAGG